MSDRIPTQEEIDAFGCDTQLWDLDLRLGDLLIIQWWPGLHIFLEHQGGQKPDKRKGWTNTSRITVFSIGRGCLGHFPGDHRAVIISRAPVTDEE